MMKRNTIQRSLVLETVRRFDGHATAEEIYDAVAAQHPHISRATVYRNLRKLADDGTILRVEVPDGADRFESRGHDHYHVRCLVCGRVFDVDMEYIEHLERSVRNTHGFQITGHDILFKGICPECQK